MVIKDLSLLIKVVSKNQRNKALKKIIKESKKYNNVLNFIEIKKYEFEKSDKGIFTILGFLLLLILTMKDFFPAIYIITFLLFLFILLIHVITRNFHMKIIEKLYKLKDKKSKEKS